MADKTSAPADDTPVSEEISTDAAETESPDSLDASDEDFDLEADDTPEESVEEPPAEPQGKSDDSEEAEESEEQSDDEPEDESKAESADEESADEEPSEEFTPSEDPKEVARRAYAEREAKRQALKQKQQQDYLDAADDDKDLALKQLQVDAYNNRVEANVNKLQNGIDRALAGIDLFKNGTQEQQEKLLREVDKFEALHVRKDANGDPVEVTGDIYQYLQQEAESIRRLTGVGARQQVRDKSRTKAKTLSPPASKPKETPKDPWVEGFQEEAYS